MALPNDVQRLGRAIELGLKRCATGEEQEPKSFWRALKEAAHFWHTFLPSLEAKESPLLT